MEAKTVLTAKPLATNEKRAYQTPRLTVYGTVRTLTAAATGTFPETRRRSGEPTRLRIF